MARPRLIKPEMKVYEVAILAGVQPGTLGYQQFKNYRAAMTLIEAAGLSSGTGMRSRYDSPGFVKWYQDNQYIQIGQVETIDGRKPITMMDLDDLDNGDTEVSNHHETNEITVVSGRVEHTGAEYIPPQPSPSSSNDADKLASLIRNLASGALDEPAVKRIATEVAITYGMKLRSDIMDEILDLVTSIEPKVTIVELAQSEAPNIPLGVQHKEFPKLLKMVAAKGRDGHRLNVWLPGPAGSGKTRAAEEAAKALGLDFYFCGALDHSSSLSGFIDAQSGYRPTSFRKAYEFGGVFLFDEVDASDPSAVLWLNAALANGHCAFPDTVITRHPDCCIIAAANTWGHGGTNDYVGRMKQDAAFMSRFVHLPWPYDLALERAITGNDDWCDYVQSVRQRVADRGIKIVISPRASIYGASLLASGLDRETVAEATLRQGMTDSDWSVVK